MTSECKRVFELFNLVMEMLDKESQLVPSLLVVLIQSLNAVHCC
jgi:hypothetical protein